MKVLTTTMGTIITNPTKEDALNAFKEISDWSSIINATEPEQIRLYDIDDDTDNLEYDIADSYPIAEVAGFTSEEMKERDENITPDEDADIFTIITDNAKDCIENDYDGRFGEFLSNF